MQTFPLRSLRCSSHSVKNNKRKENDRCRSVLSNTHQGILVKRSVDLIDMQSMPSGSNKKWIIVYQDHPTKFCILRTFTSKKAAEVASHLLHIFLLFGAPVILQSDHNGSEFTSHVITKLREVWPNSDAW
ncbi:KRAB-A domain-containing protein 2 [Plakobranchus ocellatus]|uniref:KRAB-A domain-containing protein 2 n=1 Tax=Plakobranchus ocellatus TaxID=259542 RepID=A0AAV4BZJ0_9GAST|nr:KRAB-A domain-containing protein 2 [Plakobranchus ocellatus]